MKGYKKRLGFWEKPTWIDPEKSRLRVWYRRGLLVAILVFSMLLGVVWYRGIDREIPDRLFLYENQKGQVELSYPLCQVSVQNGSKLSEVKVLGLHYKYIDVTTAREMRVCPLGAAVGLYVCSDGLMVLGTNEVLDRRGESHTPAGDVVEPGDRIYAVNGTSVESIRQFYSSVQKASGEKITLGIVRGQKKLKRTITPVCARDGEYQLGIWLREDTEGIGTLTCVTEDGRFVALGHGISDIDTGQLVSLKEGGLYQASIQKVIRGNSGTPGELSGTVDLQQCVGKIEANTDFGIMGSIGQDSAYRYERQDSMPVGLRQEVHTGAAYILCQLGDSIGRYDVEITRVNRSARDNKCMEIHVTDPDLLKQTGGIVQGMSGSPIIQGGKLIGAVNHVFVDDPTRGYGIFVEEMLE